MFTIFVITNHIQFQSDNLRATSPGCRMLPLIHLHKSYFGHLSQRRFADNKIPVWNKNPMVHSAFKRRKWCYIKENWYGSSSTTCFPFFFYSFYFISLLYANYVKIPALWMSTSGLSLYNISLQNIRQESDCCKRTSETKPKQNREFPFFLLWNPKHCYDGEFISHHLPGYKYESIHYIELIRTLLNDCT